MEESLGFICGESKRQGLNIGQQSVCGECELAIIGADSQRRDGNGIGSKRKVAWRGLTALWL